MMKKSLMVSLAVICLSLSLVGSAFAEENESSRSGNWADRIKAKFEQKKEKVEARIETKCEKVNKRIDTEVRNYTARKDLHIQNFTRMIERWTAMSARLKTKGYDTTTLDNDLSTLSGMVTKLSTSYQEFVASVDATKKTDCESGIRDFRKNLLGSRTELKQFKDQVDGIWKFIKDNIRKDLVALKDQKKNE